MPRGPGASFPPPAIVPSGSASDGLIPLPIWNFSLVKKVQGAHPPLGGPEGLNWPCHGASVTAGIGFNPIASGELHPRPDKASESMNEVPKLVICWGAGKVCSTCSDTPPLSPSAHSRTKIRFVSGSSGGCNNGLNYTYITIQGPQDTHFRTLSQNGCKPQ